MKCFFRHGGIGLLLLLCCLTTAHAQSAANRVSAILITNIGPAAASTNLVLANIHVKAGDTYDPKVVFEDIPNLYATGLFANIQITDRRTSDGVELTYILRGKPRVTAINFTGNTKFSNAKLLKKVTSKVGAPFDELTLLKDTQAIEKLYESKGYVHTTVRYEEVNLDQAAGRAGVLFQVTETPKILIKDVEFPGAQDFTQSKLRGVLKTRRHWMFSWITSSGVFKDDDFDEDMDKLADFYRNQGYIDFEVKATNFIRPTPRTMIIQIVVDEGRQYRVGSVTFKGNDKFTVDQISAGIKLRHDRERLKTKIGEHGLEADTGMVFKPDALNHDLESIQDFYGSKGYIGGYLNPPQGGVRVNQIPNTETGTIDLEYQVDEGDRSRIEKIDIQGNTKTKDRVIRRELLVSPGEVFDMVRVKNSQHRLEQMGYFVPDSVRVEPQADPGNLPSDAKNLVITVQEQSTGNVSVGAGYNTVESVTGFVSVEEDNFDLGKPPYFIGTGGGQKLLMKATVGTLLQDYELNFIEPWFLGRHLQLSTSLYDTVSDYASLDSLYDVGRAGVKVGLTRALGSERLLGNINYNLEQVDIFNINTNAPNDILSQGGHTLLNRFGLGLTYDTTEDVELPNHGSRTSLSSVLTVSSESSYVKTELSTGWYFKGLATGHVLEVVGKIGVAKPLGSEDVPFFDRYYLGGPGDLRGYDYTAVGPRQVTQDGLTYEPIGGDTYWLGSLEYSVPIIDHLRFAVFYDIGNLSAKPFNNGGYSVIGEQNDQLINNPAQGFTQNYPGNTGTYSDDYGLGLRLNIPHIGPLRLDYGIPIHHDPFSGNTGRFNFSAGFTRPI